MVIPAFRPGTDLFAHGVLIGNPAIQALGYLSPMDFEAQHAQQAA